MLSGLAILRNSSKISAGNLAMSLLMFPTAIIVARVLGPERLGIAGYLTLWVFYGGLLSPGIFAAASRELPLLAAAGRWGEATRLYNVAISGEAIYIGTVVLLILAAAPFHQERALRIGLPLAAIAFAMNAVGNYVSGIGWAFQRFKLIAKVTAVSAVTLPIFTLLLLPLVGPYAPVLAPALTMLVSVCIYVWLSPGLAFALTWDGPKVRRLLRIGIPLAMGSVFYGTLKTIDRTLVATQMSLVDLGYYTFVMQLINRAILLVNDFGNVLQPTLWVALAAANPVQIVGPSYARLSLAILLITGCGTAIAQALYGAFVSFLLPQFRPTIQVFDVFVLLLTCATAGTMPSHLLNSATVGRERTVTTVWGVGVAVSAAAIIMAIRLGFGLLGVAVASVSVQLLVSATLITIGAEILLDRVRMALYVGCASALVAVAIGLTVLFQAPRFSLATSGVVSATLWRLAVGIVVWGAIASLRPICLRLMSERDLLSDSAAKAEAS